MRYLFTVSLLLLAVGCGETSTYDSGGNSSRYESEEFKNADPKVQEDIIIYDILRKQGYSDQESKDAVINSANE